MSEVKVLELTNGRAIIGKVGESANGVVNVNNCVGLDIQPVSGGGVTVGITPISYFIDLEGRGSNVTIRDDHIIFILEPSSQIKNEYNKAFGSGIVGVEKPTLITG